MKDTTTCLRTNVDEALINSAKEDVLSNSETLESKAKLFSLLGSDVRLKIVYLLLKYEKMCVCDLSDVLEMKQSPISQHLRKLKDAGVLENRREGLVIFYSVPSSMRPIIKSLI